MPTRQKIINWLVILFATTLILIWALYRNETPENYRYTIAVVTSVEGVLNGDPAANILYSVNGTTYKSSGSSYLGDRFLKKGDRVFIKYPPNSPNWGTIVSEKPVPDTLKVIPPSGWKKLP